MIKLLEIKNTQQKKFLIVVGIISDGMDIIIPHNVFFEKVIGKIESVEVHHGYGEVVSKDLLNNSKIYYQDNNVGIEVSNIKDSDENLKIINENINNRKGILLLKNHKNFSEIKIETEFFPFKKRFYFYGENEKNFSFLIKSYKKYKKEGEDFYLDFKNNLKNFFSNFYCDTLFNYFDDKDVIIYKDTKYETYVFEFQEGVILKNRDIKNNVKVLFYNENLFKDYYSNVYYGKSKKLIRKGRSLEKISNIITKKNPYTPNELINDLKNLTISTGAKINYFHKIYLPKKEKEYPEIGYRNGLKKEIMKSRQKYYGNNFSYLYSIKDTKKEEVEKYIMDIFLYIPVYQILKKIKEQYTKEQLEEILNKYEEYLYNKFSYIQNKEFYISLKQTILGIKEKLDHLIIFYRKYKDVVEDDKVLKENIPIIVNGLKIHYYDVIKMNYLSQKEITIIYNNI